MDFFTKKERMAILSIAVILLAYFGIGGYIKKKQSPPIAALISGGNNGIQQSEADQPEEDEPLLIMVHISGQVYFPGIYELVNGDRVVDAVELAGGLTKSADLDRINLAKKVKDEEKIFIPEIGIEIPADIEAEVQSAGSGLININTCSKNDLESLPGIGEVIAERIIQYRDTSKFYEIEDIRNVSGIGDAKFNSIKDLITVD
jgi:competence protein ComEA